MSAIESLKAVLRRYRWRIASAQAFRRVYESPEGQAVLHDLLRESGLLEVSHEPGDPHHSAFRDGRRAMGLYILQQLRWSEAELVKLAEEQTQDRLNQQQEGVE